MSSSPRHSSTLSPSTQRLRPSKGRAPLELPEDRIAAPPWLRRPFASELNIALVVPDRREGRTAEYDEWGLRAEIRAGMIDMVVFPENFQSAALDDAAWKVDALAKDLKVPVLTGVWVDDAYQTAFYANPFACGDETRVHFYFKHSTSVKTAYEWPHYRDYRYQMFAPIRLRGATVGVHLCHDMFFGLVPAKLRASGATTLIDLTGGDVMLTKWTNVMRGRSIEHSCRFLCTMAKTDRGGQARALGYDRGRPLRPLGAVTETEPGRHVIFGAKVDMSQRVDASRTQAFSPKTYDGIQIGLDAKPSRGLDVLVTNAGGRLSLSGVRPLRTDRLGWRAFATAEGTLGVATLPVAALRDPYVIYRIEPRPAAFDHHLVVYGGAGDDLSHDEVIALLRLRAIEHRMACGYLGNHGRELLRTTRYKNIQRIRHVGGVFGVDGNWMGGTFASASETSELGVPHAYIDDYLALCSDL